MQTATTLTSPPLGPWPQGGAVSSTPLPTHTTAPPSPKGSAVGHNIEGVPSSVCPPNHVPVTRKQPGTTPEHVPVVGSSHHGAPQDLTTGATTTTEVGAERPTVHLTATSFEHTTEMPPLRLPGHAVVGHNHSPTFVDVSARGSKPAALPASGVKVTPTIEADTTKTPDTPIDTKLARPAALAPLSRRSGTLSGGASTTSGPASALPAVGRGSSRPRSDSRGAVRRHSRASSSSMSASGFAHSDRSRSSVSPPRSTSESGQQPTRPDFRSRRLSVGGSSTRATPSRSPTHSQTPSAAASPKRVNARVPQDQMQKSATSTTPTTPSARSGRLARLPSSSPRRQTSVAFGSSSRPRRESLSATAPSGTALLSNQPSSSFHDRRGRGRESTSSVPTPKRSARRGTTATTTATTAAVVEASAAKNRRQSRSRSRSRGSSMVRRKSTTTGPNPIPMTAGLEAVEDDTNDTGDLHGASTTPSFVGNDGAPQLSVNDGDAPLSHPVRAQKRPVRVTVTLRASAGTAATVAGSSVVSVPVRRRVSTPIGRAAGTVRAFRSVDAASVSSNSSTDDDDGASTSTESSLSAATTPQHQQQRRGSNSAAAPSLAGAEVSFTATHVTEADEHLLNVCRKVASAVVHAERRGPADGGLWPVSYGASQCIFTPAPPSPTSPTAGRLATASDLATTPTVAVTAPSALDQGRGRGDADEDHGGMIMSDADDGDDVPHRREITDVYTGSDPNVTAGVEAATPVQIQTQAQTQRQAQIPDQQALDSAVKEETVIDRPSRIPYAVFEASMSPKEIKALFYPSPRELELRKLRAANAVSKAAEREQKVFAALNDRYLAPEMDAWTDVDAPSRKACLTQQDIRAFQLKCMPDTDALMKAGKAELEAQGVIGAKTGRRISGDAVTDPFALSLEASSVAAAAAQRHSSAEEDGSISSPIFARDGPQANGRQASVGGNDDVTGPATPRTAASPPSPAVRRLLEAQRYSQSCSPRSSALLGAQHNDADNVASHDEVSYTVDITAITDVLSGEELMWTARAEAALHTPGAA